METQKERFRLVRALPWTLVVVLAFYSGLTCRELGPVGLTPEAAAAPRKVAPRRDLRADEVANIELFREAAPSVVYITTLARRRNAFSLSLREIPRGTGSGFIWDRDGHIVTNYHVLEGATAALVTLADQSTWDASYVGGTGQKDLAVLRIQAPASRLRPIPVGASNDLAAGQKVFAIGNPFGLDQTLTTGIISALGREIESLERIPIQDVIQTDAAINPGNSGGPLLDSSGRLIGVNTQIYSPSGASAGIGFAIPADTVNWVVPDLITYGEIRRPYLGVELGPDHILRRYSIKGVLIWKVTPGGGADSAGLEPTRQDSRGRVRLGDIITAIDGQSIESSGDLILRLEKYKVGDRVRVKIIREEREQEVQVVLGRRN